jgi:hypothetical protein
MFLEDYRYKALCTRRQKNMDSAFENLYQTVRQDSFSRPLSVAGTGMVESLIGGPECSVSIISELNFLHVIFSVAEC